MSPSTISSPSQSLASNRRSYESTSTSSTITSTTTTTISTPHHTRSNAQTHPLLPRRSVETMVKPQYIPPLPLSHRSSSEEINMKSRTPRTPRHRVSFGFSLSSQSHRIMHELFKTEAFYLDSLELLKCAYRDPLLAHPKKIPGKTVEGIFPNFDAMHKIHEELLSEMRKLFEPPPESVMFALPEEDGLPQIIGLGNLFARKAKELKFYSVFVRALDEGRQVRRQLEVDKVLWHDIFQPAMADPRAAGRGFEALIIMPLQRVLKYSLLLGELLKHATTPQEKKCLETAIEQVKAVTDKLNDSQRNSDARSQLRNWAEKLKEHAKLFKECRFVVHEFKCGSGCPGYSLSKAKKDTPVDVIVCNDLIFVVANSKLIFAGNPYEDAVLVEAMVRNESHTSSSSNATLAGGGGGGGETVPSKAYLIQNKQLVSRSVCVEAPSNVELFVTTLRENGCEVADPDFPDESEMD